MNEIEPQPITPANAEPQPAEANSAAPQPAETKPSTAKPDTFWQDTRTAAWLFPLISFVLYLVWFLINNPIFPNR